jgi:hypothetical protein
MRSSTTSGSLALIALLAATSPARAAQYFVSSNGDDSAAGTSAQTPFRTPERALRALSGGDALYFRAGDYWRLREALHVNVSGTAQMPVVIGAYTVSSAGQIQLSASDSRPILDGGTTTPSLGEYVGLIDVRGRYVHVQDLELRNSGGYGIAFVDTSFGMVENVKVDWVYHSGIVAQRSTDITIAASEVVGDSRGWRDFGSEFWSGGITVIGGARVEVHDCLVREGYGEAISAFFGANDVVFSGNTVFAARAVGIYINSAHDVEIRNNMVLGTSDSAYHRSDSWVGPGIALGNEQYQYQGFGGSLSLSIYTRNVRIVNNLVAATQTGVAFWNEIDVPMESVEVSHNTFVENAYQIDMTEMTYRNSSISNNIFLSLAFNTHDAQGLAPAGIAWSSNYWSEGVPTPAARHSRDIHHGLTLRKMAGWQDIRAHTDVTWADFEPLPGAPTIGASAASTATGTDFNGFPFGDPADVGALADRGGAGSRPRRPIIVSLLQ